MSAKTITALVQKILAAKESVGRLRERIAQLQRQIEQWSREVTRHLTAEPPTASAVSAPSPRKRAVRRSKAPAKPVPPAPAASEAAQAAAAAETKSAPAKAAKKPAARKPVAAAKAQNNARPAAAAKAKPRITIREAVLKILSEKSPATVKEIREGIERLGGATRSLHVALSVLAKDKVIESAGYAQYRLPKTTEPSAEPSQS